MGESKGEKQIGQEKDDTDLFEIILFNISPILGGRSEVMNAPFIECLKHLELVLNQRKSDRWNKFMDMFYSNAEVDNKKRKEYVKLIQPKEAKKQLAMKTNIDQLKAIKEKQNRPGG
ncbi:hypothetical protein BpsM61_00059 [Bacillus phage vB_BpsM-61]|nr:hypothetical protein BpsM61_00059 [Bacillus phage vB_BpsM-61]